MKKLFTFIAIAALATACCNKQPAALSVEKFFENPTALVGTETTVTGAILAVVCPETGSFVIGTETQQLMVVPPADMKICKKSCMGKEVIVKGVVKDMLVNEEFLVKFEQDVNAYECPEMKEACLAKLVEFKAQFETQGEYPIYYIEATEVTPKDGCCKDKEAKEGCEKSCEKKHEGCEKHGEGEKAEEGEKTEE